MVCSRAHSPSSSDFHPLPSMGELTSSAALYDIWHRQQIPSSSACGAGLCPALKPAPAPQLPSALIHAPVILCWNLGWGCCISARAGESLVSTHGLLLSRWHLELGRREAWLRQGSRGKRKIWSPWEEIAVWWKFWKGQSCPLSGRGLVWCSDPKITGCGSMKGYPKMLSKQAHASLTGWGHVFWPLRSLPSGRDSLSFRPELREACYLGEALLQEGNPSLSLLYSRRICHKANTGVSDLWAMERSGEEEVAIFTAGLERSPAEGALSLPSCLFPPSSCGFATCLPRHVIHNSPKTRNISGLTGRNRAPECWSQRAGGAGKWSQQAHLEQSFLFLTLRLSSLFFSLKIGYAHTPRSISHTPRWKHSDEYLWRKRST